MSATTASQPSLEELIKKGLLIPAEKLDSICDPTNALYQLCNVDPFWRAKLEKDFPKYVPNKLPSSLTYREYYRLLRRTGDLQSSLKRPLLKNMTPLRDEKLIAPVLMLYPVPLFNIEQSPYQQVGHNLKEDILVDPLRGANIYLVGFRDRRLITGLQVPTIGQNIPRLSFEQAAKVSSKEAERAQDKATELGYRNYIFIDKKYYGQLVKEALDAGFVRPFAELYRIDIDRSAVADTNLFNQLLIAPVKKPSPKTTQEIVPVSLSTLQEKKPMPSKTQDTAPSSGEMKRRKDNPFNFFYSPKEASPETARSDKPSEIFWPGRE